MGIDGARHIHEALRIHPDWGEARLAWATVLLQQDRLEEAARELARAARDGAEPALVLAATGVLAGRRGDASARANPEHAFVQGTLAAAYASAGRMADAVSTQERALAILLAQGDLSAVGAFSDRLEAYRDGRQPWQSE